MHDAIIMTRAAALGGYATIGPDLLRAAELEYAGFEARVAAELPRAGEIHVIDRANDRIDAIQALLDAGAAVAGIERGGGDSRFFELSGYLGVNAEVDPAEACTAIIEAFGGIDHVNAAAHWQTAFQPFMDLDNA
jgi:hypothetical protein